MIQQNCYSAKNTVCLQNTWMAPLGWHHRSSMEAYSVFNVGRPLLELRIWLELCLHLELLKSFAGFTHLFHPEQQTKPNLSFN